MRRNSNNLWPQRAWAALAAALACAAPAQAIVVLKKGVEQPLLGHLVRRDEREVVIREELPADGHRETHIPRSDIEELIVTVDPERMAALDPAQPRAYREYAEELAEKRRDPEARDAARRLYAIAAVRGDAALRKGALLGLLALARSPAEERRLRAAVFLYDEQHDPAVLARVAPSPLAPGQTREAATAPPAELLSAVRLIRQGRGAEARSLLELPHARRAAPALAPIVSLDELLAAAAARTLTDEQLVRLLTAELSLSGEAPAAKTGEPPPWGQTVKNGRVSPLPSLELEALTEFDPAECVFRGGKWTRP